MPCHDKAGHTADSCPTPFGSFNCKLAHSQILPSLPRTHLAGRDELFAVVPCMRDGLCLRQRVRLRTGAIRRRHQRASKKLRPKMRTQHLASTGTGTGVFIFYNIIIDEYNISG